MRKILLIAMLLPVAALGQKSEIIESSKDKAQLYSYSLEWVAKKWKSANDVIQNKDPEAGVIVVKGGLTTVPSTMGIPAKGITLTTLTIRVKDGKAKMEFESTNFKWEAGQLWDVDNAPKSGKKQWEKWKGGVLEEIDALIIDYKKGANKEDDF